MTTSYSTTPKFQDINVGDELPTLVKQPNETQLFMYSAVTWDTHRTHWDIPYSVNEEHLPGILVHGRLQGTWLTQMMTDWAMPYGKVAFKFLSIRLHLDFVVVFSTAGSQEYYYQ